MYFSRTPRDKKDDAGTALSSTMVSTSSAPSRRVRPCGLCAREFLLEALPGSAPREAVARLRAEREGVASGALAGQAPPPHSATPRRRRDAAETDLLLAAGAPGHQPAGAADGAGPGQPVLRGAGTPL
ncbi:unnamed protein product [Prorocentrum cordatum]|uniref:Uncharacterized protein n=1 Tax=Prorocentrum cordatum TaxID=2364126 RepID=A0ABN9Y9D0_9DINO|nr:unnamed protein product [Polarella glacialis]